MTNVDSRYVFQYVPPGIVRAGFSDMTDFCIKCDARSKSYYFYGVGKGQGYARIDEYVISVPDALDRVYGTNTGSRPVYVKTIEGAERSELIEALRSYIELHRTTNFGLRARLSIVDGESKWSWPGP